MNARFVVLGMVVAVLVLGCGTADTPPESSADEPSEEPRESDADRTSDQGVSESFDLADYDTLAEAMQTGRSVYCTGTQDGQSYEFWADGGNVRTEASDTVMVFKDDTLFVQSGQGGCDWMRVEATPMGDEPRGAAPSYERPENVSLAEYRCEVRDAPRDAFATPGSVCDMRDMMGGMPGSLPTE
jgi:hypothetical protein